MLQESVFVVEFTIKTSEFFGIAAARDFDVFEGSVEGICSFTLQ